MDTEKPLVSAVITTHGRRKDRILPGILSVLSQTFPPAELLIIDDNGEGSLIQRETELFADGLKAYAKSKGTELRYLKNKKNMGAQYSRNLGIRESRGEYIAFLDDDDRWTKDKLRLQMKLFNDKNVGLVYSKGRELRLRGEEIISAKPYNMALCFNEKANFKDLLYGDYIGSTSQAVIRREVFEICGMFDEGQPARQDYEMWIRISRKYSCRGVPEYLFDHCIHEGEQLGKDRGKVTAGLCRIFEIYGDDMGPTAKLHISMMTAKELFLMGKFGQMMKWGISSAAFFIIALLWDRKELFYRIIWHLKRKSKEREFVRRKK